MQFNDRFNAILKPTAPQSSIKNGVITFRLLFATDCGDSIKEIFDYEMAELENIKNVYNDKVEISQLKLWLARPLSTQCTKILIKLRTR